MDGELYDIASLTKASEEDGILLLMSDSTNTERPGFTPSEKTVWKGLDEAFAGAAARIIVTTFASNVHRMRQIIEAAIKHGRKVTVLGRSMIKLAGLSRELGYMSFPDDLFVDIRNINQVKPEKIAIITTGSQGEPLSGLTRIARNQHKQIKILPGDTVIFSASPIPGNERLVANTINTLFMLGANVVYGSAAGVHVSGHACREEQKLMLNLCKPKFFMPIHGEHRMLVSHAELAVECGIAPENTFPMENGDVLQVFPDNAKVSGRVTAGVTFIDNSRSYPVELEIIEERRRLAESGVINVAITLTHAKEILSGPDIFSKGLVLAQGRQFEELDNVREHILRMIQSDPAIRDLSGNDLRDYFIENIGVFFMHTFGFAPLVQVLLQELSSKNPTDKSAERFARSATEQHIAVPNESI